MGLLYIENYLKISRGDKLDFFILIGAFKNFKVQHQKVILNNNALLLEFSEDSDIEFAKEVIEKFFEDIGQDDLDINVIKVKQLVQENKEIVVTFENGGQKRIKL